ncbi:MAG: hypothetical protein A2821_02840 [Candidatus Magasanikbacteria bacterium RIFCSPHIGHO2_01_FULL_41_23]|uniref:Polyprenyl synthetase n=1 Tax=Candidatus Magasanikbacteria bacterium RIFCSPLOWO2_01_FULL_40_15 TaxID=1798686 RepID=A0A1F6N3F3_9BACT|nr:MAG: hypothetical protein A2821_02840 [Candidatus Magasanikbacteria bacterium RIFCSPHIGHO2_01_FULL_41_23]OGH67274.1 MAG: hypothetical protein A3C66_00855 [Candidatus Magasanikbacteria bacterium RIFCSPHIGHO2_02_FULL_41_35]OGH76499.1 MAG: hypothetical protein A3F22_00065 [Candidatus Magasanikbacteria bacterium RIFCSPHIGHO2_12_FULL_41_16]OGH78515.1 MAG: hypothetical protein A2983_03290 [Candidatus Magasanikbacteria bacterium RIFCSPLOWO2_01_FULL_40_15]
MKDIERNLATWRQNIAAQVRTVIDDVENQAREDFSNDHYIFKELQLASQIGKAWRGGLCLLSAESFGAKETKIVEQVAGLIEVLHYALLIHDDIIDESPIRRDTLSFPARLKAIFEGRGVLAYERHGVGTAIAVGDYLIQFVLNQLISLECANETKVELLTLFLNILTRTTRAQVYDAVAHEPTHNIDDVLHLYESKTGAYSFVLPLVSGFILSHTPDETTRLFLKAIGESLGIAFQALDDLAGFNENGNSKNLIEDLNNKQPTLWCALLLPELNRSEKEKFNYTFWLDQIPLSQANYVRELCGKYKIREKILDMVQDHTGLCHDLVHDLPISKQNRRLFHQFVGLVQEYSGV